jgi:DNA modification methylase/ribosomal protein L12E/L44/L45/RPP1/RPP2
MTEKHANLELWKSAPLAEINHPHPKNPRVIPDADSEEVRTLDASLEHDYFDPLIWNKRNRMWVSGHVRAWRMTALGFTHADVVVVDYDEETHLARMLAANAHSGKNDEDKLDALLASLRDASVDPVLALLSALPPAPPPAAGDADAEPDTDRAAELNKIWQVETGQVWQIGPHRLMCGNSCSAESVSLLLDQNQPRILFTSPPYDQQREYRDTSGVVKDWQGLMRGVFAAPVLADDVQIFVNLGLIHRECEVVPYFDEWIQWMRAQGWLRFGWYVWDQGFGLPGDWNGRLAPSHEFVFHFTRKPTKALKFLPKKEENIKARGKGNSTMRGADGKCRDFSSPEASAQPNKLGDSVVRVNRMPGGHGIEHPAIFPPQFPSFFLQSWEGACYDPFLGSGTTMLAAQNLHRICYGMEISPDYCAVILDRMHRAFPDLEIKRVA